MAAPVRTHHPVWRAEQCLPCGGCTGRCPTSLFVEQRFEADSLRGRLWREVAIPRGEQPPAVQPCVAACPLGQDVPEYLGALARGDADQALAVISKTNPLPAVCGRLCLAACMQACVRNTLDKPVAIRALKSAAVRHASSRSALPAPADAGRPVVVIGAGPAGLAAAWELSRSGLAVQLLEAREQPGGLLAHAVPVFELPEQELRLDLERILAGGVELVCSRPLTSPGDLQALFDAGAPAVLLATGAACGQSLGIAGEDLEGCMDAVRFAAHHRRHPEKRIDQPVVVVGGGPAAVAATRLAKRAGAPRVHWVSRQGRRELPVRAESLHMALQEGVELVTEARPVRILGEGTVTAVRCEPIVYSMADAVGRRRPLSTGEPFEVQAGLCVMAEGRLPDLSWLQDDPRMPPSPLGTLRVWADGSTGWPGVFAAGELALGSRNVVAAMAHGIGVARAMGKWVGRS